MAQLILINGAPGSGKSTLAAMLSSDRRLALAIDVDIVKHAIGQWQDYMPEAGIRARQLALAMASDHLAAGNDVVVAQFLARQEFIHDLEALAGRWGARWCEVILQVGEAELGRRLAGRSANPNRPEHAVNGPLTPPSEATALIRSIDALAASRPHAVTVDAGADLTTTYRRLLEAIAAGC